MAKLPGPHATTFKRGKPGWRRWQLIRRAVNKNRGRADVTGRGEDRNANDHDQ
jgi:hypothetical protein